MVHYADETTISNDTLNALYTQLNEQDDRIAELQRRCRDDAEVIVKLTMQRDDIKAGRDMMKEKYKHAVDAAGFLRRRLDKVIEATGWVEGPGDA